MRRLNTWIPTLLLAFASIAPAQAAKPFRRVLVLTGGSLEFATRVGIWHGLQEAGWKPDLVITTCGSALVGAMIQAQPNARAVHDTFLSRDFYEALDGATDLENSSGLESLINVYFKDDRKHVPHVFNRPIVRVAHESPTSYFRQRLNSHRPRVLTIAAKMNFGPALQDESWENLAPGSIQEVFLTDRETAARLPRLKALASKYSNRISPQIDVQTDWEIWDAARAGFAEPYLLSPSYVNGDYYTTGAIDLVPVELGLALGDEVMITYGSQMDGAHSRGFENLFGFSQNERGRAARATQAKGLRWIDLSDDDKVNKKYGIGPVLPFLSRWIPIPGMFLEVKERMPKTYEEYVDKTQHQYDYGSERALEALATEPNGSHAHIRKPWK